MDFFEALAHEMPPDTPRFRAVQAGLLTLRFIDQWVHFSATLVAPNASGLCGLQQAILALPETDPLRRSLTDILAVVLKLPATALDPVLPELFSYGKFLEQGGELALAADVYESIARLAESSEDSNILIASFSRAGYCRRWLSEFITAERHYKTARRLAIRNHAIAPWIRVSNGLVAGIRMRGDLLQAKAMLDVIRAEGERTDCHSEYASTLQESAWVALQMGELEQAECLITDAYERQDSPVERDRILGDLGGILIRRGRYDEAKEILLAIDERTNDQNLRRNARINIVALAVRVGDRELFYSGCAGLAGAMPSPEQQVHYYIESARGFRRFGAPAEARPLLLEAHALSMRYGLKRSCAEAQAMLVAT